MILTCDLCGNEFVANVQKQQFINTAIQKDMHFLMVECAVCLRNFALNPQDFAVDTVDTKVCSNQKHKSQPQSEAGKDMLIRCPTKDCDGWVVAVDNFWGCGECGVVWQSKDTLDMAIGKIINIYPD